MKQRTLATLVAAPLLLALVLVAVFVPLPYATYGPGLTVDVLGADSQTAAGAASGGPLESLGPMILPVALVVLFYFMILRPQQRRVKEHQAMVSAVKRGDTVVLSSGIIGKVTRVEDAEVQVEIAPNVNVKVVKSTLSEVRTRGEPAPANDAKS